MDRNLLCGALDRFSESPWRYLAYLILLLPFFIFRDYTPSNELRYISIAEEAIANGTWFTFHNHGAAYADKPPLYFWMIMLSRLLTGGYHMWIIGLFSLVPAVGVLAVMDRWMRRAEAVHVPVVSNLLLLTTAMFLASALVVRMDMLMALFIVLALYTFFKIYEGSHRRLDRWLLPVYIFLAIFSKGPMGFLIPVVSIYAFLAVKRDLRRAGRYFSWGQWGVLLGLCAAWFACVYIEGGNEYLNNLLFKQTVGRGVDSFHHKEPFWYYLPRMFWSFAPWIFLYIALVWQGIRRKAFTTDLQRFFATVFAATFVLLSLVSSKLDIYLLPAYPFAVYLCAPLLAANAASRWVKAAVAIPAAIFALLLPAFIFGRGFMPLEVTGTLPYIGTGLLTAGGAAAIVLLFRNKTQNAIICMAAAFIFTVFAVSFAVPQVNRHIGFGELAASAQEKAHDENIENYAYYKYDAFPNMDVFLGRPVEYVGSVGQLDSLASLPRGTILFVREKNVRREEALRQWIGERQPEWSAAGYGWYVIGGE